MTIVHNRDKAGEALELSTPENASLPQEMQFNTMIQKVSETLSTFDSMPPYLSLARETLNTKRARRDDNAIDWTMIREEADPRICSYARTCPFFGEEVQAVATVRASPTDVLAMVLNLNRVREYMFLCREACVVKDLLPDGSLSIIYMSFYGVGQSAAAEDVFYLRFVDHGTDDNYSCCSGGGGVDTSPAPRAAHSGDAAYVNDLKNRPSATNTNESVAEDRGGIYDILFIPLRGPFRSLFRRLRQSHLCLSLHSVSAEQCLIKYWCNLPTAWAPKMPVSPTLHLKQPYPEHLIEIAQNLSSQICGIRSRLQVSGETTIGSKVHLQESYMSYLASRCIAAEMEVLEAFNSIDSEGWVRVLQKDGAELVTRNSWDPSVESFCLKSSLFFPNISPFEIFNVVSSDIATLWPMVTMLGLVNIIEKVDSNIALDYVAVKGDGSLYTPRPKRFDLLRLRRPLSPSMYIMTTTHLSDINLARALVPGDASLEHINVPPFGLIMKSVPGGSLMCASWTFDRSILRCELPNQEYYERVFPLAKGQLHAYFENVAIAVNAKSKPSPVADSAALRGPAKEAQDDVSVSSATSGGPAVVDCPAVVDSPDTRSTDAHVRVINSLSIITEPVLNDIHVKPLSTNVSAWGEHMSDTASAESSISFQLKGVTSVQGKHLEKMAAVLGSTVNIPLSLLAKLTAVEFMVKRDENGLSKVVDIIEKGGKRGFDCQSSPENAGSGDGKRRSERSK